MRNRTVYRNHNSGWAECSVAALPEARKPGLGVRLAPLDFQVEDTATKAS